MQINEILVNYRDLALNTEWLMQHLPEYFWRKDESPGEITAITAHGMTESPKRITISYQIEITNDDGVHLHRLLGIIVNPENFDKEMALIRRRREVATEFGKPVIAFEDASLILLGFPNDRHLYLLSGDDVYQWLEQDLPKIVNGSLNGNRWQIADLDLSILRYIPGKRYTARCRATIHGEDDDAREISFIAKQLKRPDQAQTLFENLHILPKIWKDNLADMDFTKLTQDDFDIPVRIPRPYALDTEKNIVFLEDLPGRNLEEVIAEIDYAEIIPAVGELLANFHCACRPVRKIITFESELALLRKAGERILRRQPEENACISALLENMKNTPETDTPLITLLHGTFRVNHLFLAGKQLSLLDLDNICMGHPAFDIANFFSSLYYMEAQGIIDVHQRRDIMRYFLQGYLAQTNWEISPKILLWYLASLMIHKQAFKYVKHLRKDRAEKTDSILNIAEAIMALYNDPDLNIGSDTIYQKLP